MWAKNMTQPPSAADLKSVRTNIGVQPGIRLINWVEPNKTFQPDGCWTYLVNYYPDWKTLNLTNPGEV